MKYLIKTINTSLVLLIILFSGCNVADDINKNILEIEEDDEDTSSSTSSKSNSENKVKDESEQNTSSDTTIQITDTNISTGTDSPIEDTNDSTSSNNDNNSSSQPLSCDIGYHIENDTCVIDPEISEFNLTILKENRQIKLQDEYNKSAVIMMGKNENRQITIKSNPKQPGTKLNLNNLTNNDVVITTLNLNGVAIADKDYNYGLILSSGEKTGKEEFQLTLTNDKGYTDSVYINVEVINQIKLFAPRQKYTLVRGGDFQNITIRAFNLLGNPLQFEIVQQKEINDNKKLLLTIQGSKVFYKNTQTGVDFKFSAKGLDEVKREIEIKVTDTKTNTSDSIFITIESVKRNSVFYVDLYECNEDYTKNYSVTQDANTPTSPDGVYSADNAIYIKSTHEMSYDIGNRFSTVMVFHQVTGNGYSYDRYGREYIRNQTTGENIATLYYADVLQGMRYYIKYFDENKNSIVCEKRNFPYLGAVSQDDIESSWVDAYSIPSGDSVMTTPDTIKAP